MKLLVRKSKESFENNYKSDILSVWSFEHYYDQKKTDEQINDAIKSSNEHAGYEAFSVIEAPEELDDVLNFMLGEGKYIGVATIRSLKERLKECLDSGEEIQCMVSDFISNFEDLHRKLKQFVENLKDKDKE